MSPHAVPIDIVSHNHGYNHWLAAPLETYNKYDASKSKRMRLTHNGQRMHPIFPLIMLHCEQKICGNQEESYLAVSSQHTAESYREMKFLKLLTFISHPQIPPGLSLLCYGRDTAARADDARVSTGCTTAHFSSVPGAVLCSAPRRIRAESILEVFHFLGLFSSWWWPSKQTHTGQHLSTISSKSSQHALCNVYVC